MRCDAVTIVVIGEPARQRARESERDRETQKVRARDNVHVWWWCANSLAVALLCTEREKRTR